jgi:hypothetical protein
MSNRNERRALRKELVAAAKEWPEALAEVPRSAWPEREHQPLAVWRSRAFLVQVYERPPYGDAEVLQLAVNRALLKRGAAQQWDDGISWDELQRLKREAGYGDWYGFEVYPRDKDVVNVANMRHLWLCSEPLPIGWFK